MEPIRLKLVPGGHAGDLLAQGWIKQTTIGEPRLSEIVENYRNMGYEVHVVEHLVEPDADGCNTCFHGPDGEAGQMYGDVYIRGKAKPLENDLF